MFDLGNDIAKLINNRLGNINTFDIGIVKSLNEENNTLNVTLMHSYQSRYNNFTDSEIPLIELTDIPVLRPLCRDFRIEPEYAEKDRVLVAYTKKDIITQLDSDVPLNMSGYKNFTISNAIVLGTIPKWLNFPPIAKDEDDTTISFMHKNGMTIQFDTDGGMYITSRVPYELLREEEKEKVDEDYPRDISKLTFNDDGSVVLQTLNEKSKDESEEKAAFTMNPDGSFSIVGREKYGIWVDAEGNMTIKASNVNFVKSE